MSQRRLVLWLDNVRKPANIGACMRLALAFDAELVLSGPATRMGASTRYAAAGFEVEPTRFPHFDDAEAALRERGLRLVGSSPHQGVPSPEMDWRGPVAIVLGSEVSGLSRAKLERLDQVARIPMPGPVESLNIATAAGILLYAANLHG